MRYLPLIVLSVLIAGCGQTPTGKQAPFTQQALISPPVHGGAGTGEAYVNAAAFSPDNKYLITGYFSNLAAGQPGHRKRLTLWDVATGKEILSWEGHNGRVSFVSFLPHGKCAVTAGWDGMIKLWEIPSGKQVWSVQAREMKPASDIAVFDSALSPDGLRILSSGESLKLWDTKDGKLIRSFGIHEGGPLAISPDSKLAISGSRGSNVANSKLTVWNLNTGEANLLLHGENGWGPVIGFLPDSKSAISLNRRFEEKKGSMVIWRVATGDVERSLDQDVGGSELTRDGKQLRGLRYVGKEQKGELRLLIAWDVGTGKVINSVQFNVNPWETIRPPVYAFSPDGSLAFTSFGQYPAVRLRDPAWVSDPTGRGIRNNLWDMNTGNMISTFSAPGR